MQYLGAGLAIGTAIGGTICLTLFSPDLIGAAIGSGAGFGLVLSEAYYRYRHPAAAVTDGGDR